MDGRTVHLRILVTGGAGFIGSHLIDKLVERRDEVLCLDAFTANYPPAIKRRNISRHVDAKTISIVKGDVCDAELVSTVFGTFRPDKVVHLAASVSVAPSVVDPHNYERVNCAGTLTLLAECVRRQVGQFVLASTSTITGNADELPLRETDEARPVSPYAATKRAAELMCYTWHHLYGLPITCLRFFTVYGPRQRPDMAIHKFVRLIDRGRPVTRYGDGSSRRDYTYVDDIVQGVLASLDRVLDYEIINLGESRTIALSELIAAIEKVMGRRATIEEKPDRPEDVRETFADISKARTLLGYDPQFPLEEGLRRFWQWYQESRDVLATEIR